MDFNQSFSKTEANIKKMAIKAKFLMKNFQKQEFICLGTPPIPALNHFFILIISRRRIRNEINACPLGDIV